MSNWRRFAVPAAFTVVVVSFAINSLVTRYLVSEGLVTPFPLTVIRFVSGLVTLQLMASAFPSRFRRTKAGLRDLTGAFFLGLYAFSISFGYFFIVAGAGALVFYSLVVITMSSYSVLKDGEKISARLIAGQALGILGIIAVTFSGLGSVTVVGVALMALTGSAWGLYSVYGRKSGGYFGYTYNSFLFFGGACILMTSVAAQFVGIGWWASISPGSLGLALYMGIISTALSYVLWNGVMKEVSASQGGTVQLLVPVLTAVLGVLLLSEKVTSTLIVGSALILAGIYINSSRKTITSSMGGREPT